MPLSTRRLGPTANRAIVVTKDFFSGGSHLSDGYLDRIIRGILQDNARAAIEAAGITDPTNSVGGTERASISALTVPTDEFDATTTGGVTLASLNTILQDFEDAFASSADYISEVNYRLGLPAITYGTGQFTAGTIPAVSITTNAGNGAGIPTQTSIAQAFSQLRNNFATILRGVNRIAAAIDYTRLADGSGGSSYADNELRDISALVASADGSDSVSKTVIDAFLTAARDNLTTAIAYLAKIVGSAPSEENITDETTGTASTTEYPALTVPALFTEAGTASVAKAEFDSLLDEVASNFAEMVNLLNVQSGRFGLPLLIDNTGGSQNTGRELNNFDVSMTGANANLVNGDDARARMTTMKANAFKIAYRMNELAAFNGDQPLALNIDADAYYPGDELVTLDAVATLTGAAVDGVGSAEQTVAKAATDTFLATLRDIFATYAARYNAFSRATQLRGLHVVAGD